MTTDDESTSSSSQRRHHHRVGRHVASGLGRLRETGREMRIDLRSNHPTIEYLAPPEQRSALDRVTSRAHVDDKRVSTPVPTRPHAHTYRPRHSRSVFDDDPRDVLDVAHGVPSPPVSPATGPMPTSAEIAETLALPTGSSSAVNSTTLVEAPGDVDHSLGRGKRDDDAVSSRRLGWSMFRGVRPLTLASDLFACLLGAWIAHPRTLPALFFTGLLVLLYISGKLYRSRLNLSVLDDLPRLVGRWIIAGAVTGALFLVGPVPDSWSFEWHNGVLAYPLAVVALVIIGRLFAYTIVRRARSARRVGHRTLILGAGKVGQQISEILRAHPEYGLNPYCFLDQMAEKGSDIAGLPVMGDAENLDRTLQEHSIHVVIIAFSSMRENEMVQMIRTCDRLDSELFVVPRLYELHHVEGDMDNAWGVPLIRLHRSPYRSVMWPVKRLVDIVCSGLALLVMGIPMALIALGVRLDGGPGVIFHQDRVGVDGRSVRVMKFRSMRPASDTEAQTQWNIANDNRVTAFGRFIRRTSLDELPQLFNILKGDMSIVGPRPERPHFVSQFQDRYPAYDARHRVPCGLTGLAAVQGLRGDTSIEDRARFDNYYIQNWSLWLDVKVILRTVLQVMRGGGA